MHWQLPNLTFFQRFSCDELIKMLRLIFSQSLEAHLKKILDWRSAFFQTHICRSSFLWAGDEKGGLHSVFNFTYNYGWSLCSIVIWLQRKIGWTEVLHIKPIIYRELFLSLGSQSGEETSKSDDSEYIHLIQVENNLWKWWAELD